MDSTRSGCQEKVKCPICGKYRIKLKSELEAAPKNNDKQEVKQAAPIREKREKKERISVQPLPKVEDKAAPIEEKGEEKTEETSGGGWMWAAIAVFVVAAAIGIYFLWHPSRKRLAAPQQNEVRCNPRLRRLVGGIPMFGGLDAALKLAGLLEKSSMTPD